MLEPRECIPVILSPVGDRGTLSVVNLRKFMTILDAAREIAHFEP